MKTTFIFKVIVLMAVSFGLHAERLIYTNDFNTFSYPSDSVINDLYCNLECPESTTDGNTGNAMSFSHPGNYSVLINDLGKLALNNSYWIGYTFNVKQWGEGVAAEVLGLKLSTDTEETIAECSSEELITTTPFSFYYKDNTFFIKHSQSGQSLYSMPLNTDKWISMVIHVNLSTTYKGYVQFYIDGVSVARVDGQNISGVDSCNNPVDSAYIKLGFETNASAAGFSAVTEPSEVVLDDLKLAKGDHGYSYVHTVAQNPSLPANDDSAISEQTTLQPDDFKAIKPGLWTFENPLLDSSVSVYEGTLSVSVPEGKAHHIWEGMQHAPMYLQAANNANFIVETSIFSPMDTRYQIAGLVFLEDEDNLVEVITFYDGDNVYVFSGAFVDGKLEYQSRMMVASRFPIYLRVSRQGGWFNIDYSYDRISWNDAQLFFHDINIRKAGVLAGNSGENPPPYLGVFEYYAVNGVGAPPVEDPIDDVTTLISDEFNVFDSDLWTFVDPKGDSSMQIDNGNLLLSVPANSAHDAWIGNTAAARLMQKSANSLFTVETKVNSLPELNTQMAGFFLDDSIEKVLRTDLNSDGDTLYLFAGLFNNQTKRWLRRSIPKQFPIYLRLQRVNGLVWHFDYSYDGLSWNDGLHFSYLINVAEVGLFIGNNVYPYSSSEVPGFSNSFEYFRVK